MHFVIIYRIEVSIRYYKIAVALCDRHVISFNFFVIDIKMNVLEDNWCIWSFFFFGLIDEKM